MSRKGRIYQYSSTNNMHFCRSESENMLRSVWSEHVCCCTLSLLLTSRVTYELLKLRLQVFVASLQRIPQLSHFMDYTGCCLSLLVRSIFDWHVHQRLCQRHSCWAWKKQEEDQKRHDRGARLRKERDAVTLLLACAADCVWGGLDLGLYMLHVSFSLSNLRFLVTTSPSGYAGIS